MFGKLTLTTGIRLPFFRAFLIFPIMFLNIFLAEGWAKIGLNIDPGDLLIQNVKPGVKYYVSEITKVDFIVGNTGSEDGIYSLSTKTPSEAGIKCFQGYVDLPDPQWLWFEDKRGGEKVTEVNVEANGHKKVELCLQIPEGKEYYNRHWEVALPVGGGSGGTFSLAVIPKYQIETKSLSGYSKDELPKDNLLEPTVIELSGVKPEQELLENLIFHNNTDEEQTYKITALSPPEQVRGMFIPWSDGYERIPTATWIVPSCKGEKQHPRTKRGKPITPLKEVTLKAGQSKKIELKIKVPEKEWQPDKKWEAFLFVISDKNKINFARIKIDTAYSSKIKK